MKLVIVEDDRDLAEMLKDVFSAKGWEVYVFYSGKSFLEAPSEVKDSDFLILDIKLPDISGLEVLEEVKREGLSSHTIVASAYADRDMAMEAIRRGADEYIQKPFDIEELSFAIDKILERERLTFERDYLRRQLHYEELECEPISVSPAMKSVVDSALKIAPYNTPVLITGESGVGKEVLAKFIHRMSPRKEGPFVAINCGAIPSELVESELFGHEKGAFTGAYERKKGLFEMASGGTIFLDEIAELPLQLQVKLLRILQDGTFMRIGGRTILKSDARVISATARNLEEEVKAGRFREDLFFRLNVIHLKIPPLRERPEDIPYLARHFLKKYSHMHGKRIKDFTPDALKAMEEYPWPGNVRELENLIERVVILCEKEYISAQDLELKTSLPSFHRSLHRRVSGGESQVQEGRDEMFFDELKKELQPAGFSVKKAQKILERKYIIRALEETGGNVLRASRLLEISHRALMYKIKEYDLEEKLQEIRAKEAPAEAEKEASN